MPPRVAGLLVFFTSALVLVLEILAGRLLAPYVGVTLESYTGIIGTVLAGISLGTWYGGRLADQVDPRKTLGPMLILGGVLALAIIPAIRFLGALRLGHGPFAIIALSLGGFFAPAAVLSAVSPTVVKLQLLDLEKSGTIVGRLSALGTAGALVGTFATGFLLVAALPSRPIVLAVGAVLVATGTVLWATVGRRLGAPTPVQLLVVAALAGGLTSVVPDPCAWESAYFCAEVVVDPKRPSGRTLVLDTVRHSYVDLADVTHLELSYAKTVGDVLQAFRPEGAPVRALHIGGGGFHLPRYLEAIRPGSHSRVLELDPTLVEIAEEQLGLVQGPRLEIRVGDARLALAEEPDGHYDLVMGDAFGGQVVPWHLTTRELISQIDRVLAPGGLYVINLIDFPPSRFARAELATLRAVFPHVGLIAAQARVEGREGGNFILLGSRAPLPVAAVEARLKRRNPEEALVVTPEALASFIGQAQVLTDDHAPVDQLLNPGS